MNGLQITIGIKPVFVFFGKCLVLAVHTAPNVCTGLSVLRGSYSKSVVTYGSIRRIKKRVLLDIMLILGQETELLQKCKVLATKNGINI
jgi:hypothetical protein